jgi:hypothetical protein
VLILLVNSVGRSIVHLALFIQYTIHNQRSSSRVFRILERKLATLKCPMSVGYHSKLRVAITFYRHHRFLPTKLHHILRCASHILPKKVIMIVWTLQNINNFT